MRFLVIVLTVALVSLIPLAGATVRAQDEPYVDEAWMGVKFGPDPAPEDTLDEFLGETGMLRQQFTTGRVVTFENEGERKAHVPEISDAEFMLVYVNTGEFVLDVMPPTSFIVQPAVHPDGQRKVARLNIEESNGVATYSMNTMAPSFVPNETGTDCTKMCTVPPATLAGEQFTQAERTAVQLLPGDWVIAPAGGLCVWCLLNTYAVSGTTGELYIYPIDDGAFSWETASPNASATPAERDLTAALMALDEGDGRGSDTLSGVMTWGYLNPAPNCRGGG